MTAKTTPATVVKCKRCEHSEGRHTKHGCRGVRCSCSGWLAGKPQPVPEPKAKPKLPVVPKKAPTKRNPRTGKVTTAKKSAMQLEVERKLAATKAVKMRTQRYSWDVIAQECGYASRGAAYNAVQRELAEIPREAVEELRAIELDSLDRAEEALQPALAKGSTYAVDSMLRIKAHRAKLTGLIEAPKDTGLGEVKEALAEFLAQARNAVTDGVTDAVTDGVTSGAE